MPPTPPGAALLFSLVPFLLAAAAAADAFPPYANHTVGGAAGWVFDSRTGRPATNYTAWAETQVFYVGDFLLFSTNANSTVIQTTNATTYALCTLDQDYGNLTSQLGADLADMSGSAGGPIPAQLTQPGDNFFFSHAAAGDQCRKGMRFRIAVTQGRGLPPQTPSPGLEPRAAAAPPIRPVPGGNEVAGGGGATTAAGCRSASVSVGMAMRLGLCSLALLAMT